MKRTALTLLIVVAATIVGCAGAGPTSPSSRLPCESLSACDRMYATGR
jgi:hypothetical protein